jgi:microcompartment protein CcmL/EutN
MPKATRKIPVLSGFICFWSNKFYLFGVALRKLIWTDVKEQVLQLFEKKLVDTLRVADDAALSEGRAIWKDIGPAPSCPSVGNVMQNIQHVLARGHLAREQAALQLVAEIAASYGKIISPKFIEELMEVVTKAFPKDHYVQFAKNTQDVYTRRAIAQKNKFNERVFKLELSLISASAANMSCQAVFRVRTFLDDALLKKTIDTPRWWVRALSVFWKLLAVLFKWMLPS